MWAPKFAGALRLIFIINNLRLLWAFDIRPPIDSTGRSILPNPDDMEGETVVRPKNLMFEFHLRGASEQTRDVIIAEAERAENEASAWTAL